MLIQDIDTLKLFLPVEKSTFPATFLPDVERAENTYIIKAIGQAVYDLIAAATPTSDQLVLLKKVRASLAPLAYYNMVPLINVRVSDKGINTSQSQTTERAMKWQVDDLRNQLLIIGYNALDQLLEFMESATGADWYNTWKASTAFTTYKRFFVNRATVMQECGANINNSRWLFTQMLPTLTNVEQLYVEPYIGTAFFEDLKTKFTNETLSNAEKIVVAKLQRGISLMTYARALKLPNFVNDLVIITSTRSDDLKDPDQHYERYKPVSKDYENMANGVMNELVAYLNANASPTVFIPYYNSDLYKDPATEQAILPIDKRTRNSSSEGTFFF